jgi:hypothetical protein
LIAERLRADVTDDEPSNFVGAILRRGSARDRRCL